LRVIYHIDAGEIYYSEGFSSEFLGRKFGGGDL